MGTSLPPPVEAQGLLVSGHVSTTLSWTGQGGSVVYDVIGGSLGDLRTQQGVTSATCLGNDVGSAMWVDPRPLLAAGNGYYYVVRAQDTCSAGTYGYASSAAERLPAAACP